METISTTNAKKFAKKNRKLQHVVERATGIPCTSTETKYIAICNSGLVNGLSEETVHEHFAKHGIIEQIVMLPGKSCCFVSYKETNAARTAYENINAKLNLAQDGKPLYLSYAESIPESNKEKTNDMPPGLILLEDFLDEPEEAMFLSLISFDEDLSSTGSMKHRQVKHFGYEFRYDNNNVDKNSPLQEAIPEQCNFLWPRLKERLPNIDGFQPDQLTVNCYKPSQGIPPHIDTHSAFEDVLVSLSLGSSIVMDFCDDSACRHLPLLVPRRSLLVMTDESRYYWTHGITPRKLDLVHLDNRLTVRDRGSRISFTFRKIRKGECNCQYTTKCDSYARLQKLKHIENSVAHDLEKLHVHNVYAHIADHFSDTRHTPWPNVLQFVMSLPPGSVLVDVGCGNGKYLGNNKNILELGCDSSGALIEVCQSRGFQAFICNCLHIPVRDQTADGVISIAVIHHLANESRRLQAIQEMVRILCVGGSALIYVWAKDQNRNKQKSSYLKQDRKNRKSDSAVEDQPPVEQITIADDVTLPVHVNRTQFQHQDLLVPWKLKGEKKVGDCAGNKQYLRFYHVFEEGELEELCGRLGNVHVVNSYYDQGNWCVLIKKVEV